MKIKWGDTYMGLDYLTSILKAESENFK